MSPDVDGTPDIDGVPDVDGVLGACGIDPGTVVARTPVPDATFNTVYRLRLRDGSGLILKIAPDPARPALSYERNLTGTEALFYRLAVGSVPVPDVVHADADAGVLLMTELPGASWHALRPRIGAAAQAGLRTGLGRLTAALHRITGPGFGYPQCGLTADWPGAFLAMLDAVLADAERFAVPLPRPAPRIREIVAAQGDLLATVRTPVLVHFDLWPGNVLLDDARPDTITGFVDGERAFWGDPVAELVSPALFGDITADAAFLAGYRSGEGTLTPDAGTRRRLAVYRSYLYLIMLVERAPRGTTGRRHEALATLVRRRLDDTLAALAGPRPRTAPRRAS